MFLYRWNLVLAVLISLHCVIAEKSDLFSDDESIENQGKANEMRAEQLSSNVDVEEVPFFGNYGEKRVHNMLHFGKRPAYNSLLHFGKRPAFHNKIHFGKRPAHNILHFGKRPAPNNMVHFGKRPSAHNMVHFGKRPTPNYMVHFGKRRNNMVHFGKRLHNMVHFGKRSVPSSSDIELQDSNQLGEKQDTKRSTAGNFIHFGKRYGQRASPVDMDFHLPFLGYGKPLNTQDLSSEDINALYNVLYDSILKDDPSAINEDGLPGDEDDEPLVDESKRSYARRSDFYNRQAKNSIIHFG